MPIWLWAESPSDRTMGPISRSASEGGYTVTATAEVERVRWSMGDGGVKTCTGPGTPNELKYGITESPTCGYRFEKQGEFTVAARSAVVGASKGSFVELLAFLATRTRGATTQQVADALRIDGSSQMAVGDEAGFRTALVM